MAFQAFDKVILQKYISDGRVDYDKIKADKRLKDLFHYIEVANLIDKDQLEQFAFWLNAYNLITIKAVFLELQKNPNWKGNISWIQKFRFFYLRKHLVAGNKISLYNIENKILRKKFKDPRIHFAINCASISCPYLPGDLFTPETLDEYLEKLTYDFINDQKAVKLEKDVLHISRIFKWYKKDFKNHGGISAFISKYWKGTSFPKDITIKYLDYDWFINSIN